MISLEDLGNLGEILGAIGVVVSLSYLAIQIRQSTRSVRASTYQAFSESFRDFRNLLVGSGRLGASVEVSFYQQRNGLLDEALVIWRLSWPREWWVENARFFNPEFRALWQDRLSGMSDEAT